LDEKFLFVQPVEYGAVAASIYRCKRSRNGIADGHTKLLEGDTESNMLLEEWGLEHDEQIR
jgi:hypothetical protein